MFSVHVCTQSSSRADERNILGRRELRLELRFDGSCALRPARRFSTRRSCVYSAPKELQLGAAKKLQLTHAPLQILNARKELRSKFNNPLKGI